MPATSPPGPARSALRYCLVGAANAVGGLTLTALLHEVAHAPEELAYAVALATLFVINFFVARHYVYEAADGGAKGQFTRFLASSASFRLLEYLGFLILHSWLGVHYLIAAPVVQVTSFVAKFLFYRAFVFTSAAGRRA